MANKQASIVDLDDEMDRFSIVAPSTIAEQELFKLPKVPTADDNTKESHEDGSSEGKAGSLNDTVPKKPSQFDESFVAFLMEQNKRLIKRLPNVASLSKDCVSYSNGRHKPSCDCNEGTFTSLEIPEPPIQGAPGIEPYAQPPMPGHHPEMPLPNQGPPIQAPPGIEPYAQPPMPGHHPQLSLPTHGPPIQAPPCIEPYAQPPFSIPGHHPPLPLPAHGPPTQAPSSIEPYSQPPIPLPGHHRPLHLPTQGPSIPAPALPEPQSQTDPYTHLPHPGPPLPVPQDPFEDLENLATERMVYNQGNDVWSALLRLARVVEAASGPATGSDSVLTPYDSVIQQFVPNPFEPNTTERQEFWSRRAQLTSDLRSLERKYGLREEFYAGKKKKAGALAAKCCKDGKGVKKSDAPGFWGLLGEKCSVGRGKGFEEVFGLVRLVVLVVVALQLYAIAGAQKSRGWW